MTASDFVRKCAVVAAAAAALVLPDTAVHAQTVDYAKSQITFAAKQMNIPAEGKFNKFTANIVWDAAKPEAGRAEIGIDTSSADMGLDDVNHELQGKEWFDVKANPQAKFVSSAVKSLGGGKFQATGKLTIKGHTQDVVAPFTVKADGATETFEGVLPIKRLQFGIGEGSWSDTATVADEVQIKFRIVAGAAPAAAPKKK
jgi:polyisoprenoid-binding protein YceI